MPAASTSSNQRWSHQLVEISSHDFRSRLDEALELYVTAMRYPISAKQERKPTWLTHTMRADWRCIGSIDADGKLTGIAYGYQGGPGQWWHEQVHRGLVASAPIASAQHWMHNYYELTELHVHPEHQGKGLGEALLRALLASARNNNVLLSTPEGPSKAWRLYRRLGFRDVLRHYRFHGDTRPFAVLGRKLPLEP